MTKTEFLALCAQACIDPDIALENDNVIDAIRAGGSRVRVHHNGRDGAIVTLDGIEGFAGVVMPLKDQVGSAGALFPADIGRVITETEKAAA